MERIICALIEKARAEWLPADYTRELNPRAILGVVQTGKAPAVEAGSSLVIRGCCADRYSGCAADLVTRLTGRADLAPSRSSRKCGACRSPQRRPGAALEVLVVRAI